MLPDGAGVGGSLPMLCHPTEGTAVVVWKTDLSPAPRSDGEMHPTLGDFSLLPLAAAKLRRAHEAAAKTTGTGLCDPGTIRTVKTNSLFLVQIAPA